MHSFLFWAIIVPNTCTTVKSLKSLKDLFSEIMQTKINVSFLFLLFSSFLHHISAQNNKLKLEHFFATKIVNLDHHLNPFATFGCLVVVDNFYNIEIPPISTAIILRKPLPPESFGPTSRYTVCDLYTQQKSSNDYFPQNKYFQKFCMLNISSFPFANKPSNCLIHFVMYLKLENVLWPWPDPETQLLISATEVQPIFQVFSDVSHDDTDFEPKVLPSRKPSLLITIFNKNENPAQLNELLKKKLGYEHYNLKNEAFIYLQVVKVANGTFLEAHCLSINIIKLICFCSAFPSQFLSFHPKPFLWNSTVTQVN